MTPDSSVVKSFGLHWLTCQGEPGVTVIVWRDLRPGEIPETVMAEHNPPSRFDKALVVLKALSGPVKTDVFKTPNEVIDFTTSEIHQWAQYIADLERTRQ